MAVNYTLGQAYDKIVEGTDIEAIADISRRFPLVTIACAKLADKQDVCSPLFNALPSYLTARKVEKGMRGPVDVEEAEEAADEAAEEEKPAPKKRGRKSKAEPKPEPEAADDADEDEGEPEGGKYDGMNAMQLFKECKKRGIKAAPKKPAKFYIELLEKADEAGSDSSDDDDEDWDI